MRLALGIDTGGTYTDAVVIDYDTTTVLHKAKALTTKHDLCIGIAAAVEQLPPASIGAVRLVSLSTTLATNAIVEQKGSRVALLLLGYDEELVRTFGFAKDFAVEDFTFIRGRFDLEGEEVEPLDLEALTAAVEARRGKVDAYAVSGYLSVRNPSHEIVARRLIRELTGLPVVCGHDLSMELGSIKRATTATLNARLIPLLRDLIASVRSVLESRQIQAPLVVVKGDGSLMSADMALERPIETVLSGPAASIVGARHLAGRGDGVVADMGGTTTDVAVIIGGLPRINPRGAIVGGWQTAIRAADVRTAGLGGDSHVRADRDKNVHVGPRRVVPVCLAAAEFPQVLRELRALRAQLMSSGQLRSAEFLMLGRNHRDTDLSRSERELVALLEGGPLSFSQLAERLSGLYFYLDTASRLEELEVIHRVALTPTDFLHVEHTYNRWNSDAAMLAVEIFAYQLGKTVAEATGFVREKIEMQIATEIMAKMIVDEIGPNEIPDSKISKLLLEEALSEKNTRLFTCQLSLQQPIIAIGAPVDAFFPAAARQLHAELVIPPHADVANAVGAVTGSVVQALDVLIEPTYEGPTILRYVVHLPEEKKDCETLQEAVDYAENLGRAFVEAEARRAGAESPHVSLEREDWIAGAQDGISEGMLLQTKLHITAVGRPHLAG